MRANRTIPFDVFSGFNIGADRVSANLKVDISGVLIVAAQFRYNVNHLAQVFTPLKSSSCSGSKAADTLEAL